MQQTCFGGSIDRPTFGYAATAPSRLNLLRIEEQLSAAHLRLSRVYVECLPYAELIRRYDRPGTFFYIDPPYWDCEDYYGPGIFSRDDFTALAKQLAGIQGRFLLSLNDTPGVRETFAAFAFEEVGTRYTTSNVSNNTPAGELLIRNY